MDTNYYSNTHLWFQITKAGEESVTFHDQTFSVGVNIKLSCNNILRLINYEEFSTGRVVAEIQQPRISNNVCIKPDQFLSYCEIRKIILGVVRIWPLLYSQREHLIRKVTFRAWEIAKSMSRNHNLLSLHVDAYVVRDDHVDSNVVSDHILESLEGRNGNSMVPATDSSIKSLERKIIEDDLGSCMICLDEFEFSKGSKAIIMPCSHMFHSNCVKQWLRTSHYCPVCRFEMPTS